MVIVIWETQLKAGAEKEGLRLTRQIWAEMTQKAGYLSHTLLVDEDTPGHLLVVSKWSSRQITDALRDTYTHAEPVLRLVPLLERPRNRWVFFEDAGPSAVGN